MLENMIKAIKDAELVFVGIGSEMQVKLSRLKEIPNFAEKLDFLEKHTEWEYLIPYLIRYYLKKEYHPEISRAYDKLVELLEGKNYFVISLSTDDLLKYSALKPERVAFPCGTYDKLQCIENCKNELYEIDETFWNSVVSWIENKTAIKEIGKPICPVCGKELVFNQYGQPVYNEEGYLDNWKIYTQWLQGTVNKKLCILELGVGMEFPSIIRWPMEKVCFYNKKSKFFRVHSTLYQLSEEIQERGISVKENPIKFLSDL